MSGAILTEEPMAKANKHKDGPTRLDAEILRKARIVVADRNVGLGKYLNDLLRPLVERDWLEVGTKIRAAESKKSKS